jgi:hypothetical protein
MENARKEVILILGMHRSGTSAVAGAFAKLGAKLPNDLMGAIPSNPRGFFESNAAVALNDRILNSLGTNWRDWRPISRLWFKTSAAQEFKKEIVNILVSDFGDSSLVVLKDPRICRLAPLWRAALTEYGFDVRVIIPFRNPLEVAESLQCRDDIPISLGLLIWLRHAAEAEFNSRDLQRAFLEWGEFITGWRGEVARIEKQLDVVLPRVSDSSALEIDEFLCKDLKHHNLPNEQIFSDARVNEWVSSSFAALCSLKLDPMSNVGIDTFDNIRRQFDANALIFGPVFADLEQQNLAKGELATEAEKLRVKVGDLAPALEHASAERDRKIAEGDALRAQAGELAATLQQANAERDRKGAEVDALRAQVGELAPALEQASAERDRKGVEVDALRAQVGELAPELEKVNLALQRKSIEFDTLGLRVNELSAALTRLSVERDEKTAELQILKSEIRDARAQINTFEIMEGQLKENILQLENENRLMKESVESYEKKLAQERHLGIAQRMWNAMLNNR